MKKERILWGVLFIIGAICLLFSHTDFMKGLQINIWNILWTIILVVILIKNLVRLNFFGIFFPLAFLCIIYDEPLGIIGIAPWTFFGAAILLSIGCNMLFPKKWKESCCHGHWNSEGSGRFECNFGAMKIYFTNTIMQGEQATIHVENNFGGTELYIPKNWIVVNQIHSAFGGVDEKGCHQPDGVHTLYIEGECNFGGIDIIYI